MTTGKIIQNLREIEGLTQEELAKQLQISRSALSLYETDRRQIPNDLLRLLAKFFKVSADYILGLEE